MAGLEDEMANVNFSRYSSAVFKVAQKEVWRVFDWLHHHHYRDEPPAHVGQRLRESEKGMEGIGAKEKAALKRQDDPATMDIPLLYRLLQHTCGLRQDGSGFDWSKAREEEQRQSLEHQLYLIKDARNSLCHRPDQYMHLSDHELGALLQELQGLLCHSLQQAGQRSGRPAGEVDDAVASVRDRLAHIQATVPPSAITPQEFELLARAELQEQWEGLGTTGECLSPPMLRWAVGEQVVTLNQLLQGSGGEEEEEPPRVLAVLGEAGIGKSSLCRQLVEAWLQGEEAAAAAAPAMTASATTAAASVEVVVVVELREVFTRDLTRLILQKLLPQTCRRCHPEEVLRLLGALRVLWLLDGFEEASADARELLHFLVEWCSSSSGSHVVVVTCQPEYMEELNARLAPAATPCYVTHCGLTQQGLHSLLASRLQSEQGAAGEGKVKQEQSGSSSSSREAGVEARCQAFLKDVEAMDPNLPRELHNPLKLVLAVQLWQEGRLREVAGASLTRLYAAIQEVLVAKLVARLRTKSTLTEAEARERVKQWVAGLCGVALAMWGRGCFVSLDEAAEQMLKDQAVKLLLSYTDCFSTFLVCRGGPGPRHSFLHHTQQSVFAAQHLQTLLLQDHTSQELLTLLLPATPSTDTTTTTTTTLNQVLEKFSQELLENHMQLISQLTTATDTTTTITTLNQVLDKLPQFELDLDPIELSEDLMQLTSQLTTDTDTTTITTTLNQVLHKLPQFSLGLVPMEQLEDLMQLTSQLTTDTDTTTTLNQVLDKLPQSSLDTDPMEQLEDLMQLTSQPTTATDTTTTTTTTTDTTVSTIKTTNGTTTTDTTTAPTKTTTTDTTASTTTTTTSLDQALDNMSPLMKELMQKSLQFISSARTIVSTINTNHLDQEQDRLSQLSLQMEHMEQLAGDFKKMTDQITTTTDHTAPTTTTTHLYQSQDMLSQLSLNLDYIKQLIKITKKMTGQTTTPADTTATTTTTTTTLDHCLPVLVHAAASLAAEGSLSEGRAKVLAELLQQCRHCPWLEVVNSTTCCPTLVREVRPRLGGGWEVTDPTVQAAAVLAAIRVPAAISITLRDNPDDLPHLMPLLHCLAKTPAYVTLHNFHSFYSTQPPAPCDSLLLPLCDPASICRLEIFSGVLTAEGSRALRQQQHSIKELHVGVLEPAALEELLQLTHNTDSLREVRISLYSIFADRPSKSVPPGVWVILHLPHVEDKEAEPAGALASCISHTFKRVVLGTASPSTVCSIVRAFRKERVHTPSLCREVRTNNNNNRTVHWSHRFPLPLPTNKSERDVDKMWNNIKVPFIVGETTPFSVAGLSMGISL